MRAVRTTTAAGALVLGFISGWLTARAGGSVERAPSAVLVMTLTLGGTALSAALLLGLRNDARWTAVALASALASHYAATWLFSPFHSPSGDILFMVVSGVLACLAGGGGFLIGRVLMRLPRA